MTESSPVNLELAIALPLGVVANQLMRIEADLRFLNMKALAYINEGEHGGSGALVAARLETINEALDLIRGLVSNIEADMQPKSASRASRKPIPERDD